MNNLIIKFVFKYSILFFGVFCSLPLFSQEKIEKSDSLVVITMNNGEVRVGKILSDDGREIHFLTKEIGQIYIRKENIKSITPYEEDSFKLVGGEFVGSGPFTTRYYFTTNALPIKKRENYAMIHLYGPEVHFALSDRFSLGIMTTWLASPFILAAKYTIPTKNEKLNFGIGTMFGTSGYLNSFRGYGGMHWGMVTYGDRMNNITFSAGFSYLDAGMKSSKSYWVYPQGTYPAYEYSPGQFSFDYPEGSSMTKNVSNLISAPIIGIGGITKIGKKASFIFDSMVLFGKRQVNEQTVNHVYDPNTGQPSYTEISPFLIVDKKSTIAFLMPGMRFQTTENKAFQVALAGVLYKNNNNELRSAPIPMVSWFFKF